MEEGESGETTKPGPPPEGAVAGEDVPDPVVRPKQTTVGTVGRELIETDFLGETREFMRRSKGTEAMLFDQIEQLRSNMPKLQSDDYAVGGTWHAGTKSGTISWR